jgi:hypothetical protein
MECENDWKVSPYGDADPDRECYWVDTHEEAVAELEELSKRTEQNTMRLAFFDCMIRTEILWLAKRFLNHAGILSAGPADKRESFKLGAAALAGYILNRGEDLAGLCVANRTSIVSVLEQEQPSRLAGMLVALQEVARGWPTVTVRDERDRAALELANVLWANGSCELVNAADVPF